MKKNLNTKDIRENRQQDREKDKRKEIAVITTKKIGSPTKNTKPESRHARTVEKGQLAKTCRLEHRRQQNFLKTTEPEETEESDADKSIDVITEIKHVTDRNNHLIMTTKKTEQKKAYRGYKITGYKLQKKPGDEETIKTKKVTYEEKSRCTSEPSEIPRKNYGRSRREKNL